jgi:hypothetical protein
MSKVVDFDRPKPKDIDALVKILHLFNPPALVCGARFRGIAVATRSALIFRPIQIFFI